MLAILIFAGTLELTCDSKADEPDLEQQQWQALLLTLPMNVQGTCEQAVTAAFACGSQVGFIRVKVAGTTIPVSASSFYVGFQETAYSLTVAAPKGAPELCTAITNASNYPVPGKTNSAGAKICTLECERLAWTALSAAGQCSTTVFQTLTTDSGSAGSETTILSLSNATVYNDCTKRCLQTGTLLPQ